MDCTRGLYMPSSIFQCLCCLRVKYCLHGCLASHIGLHVPVHVCGESLGSVCSSHL